MQRKSISKSEYTAILRGLVITRMHSDVMSMTSGTHRDYGRVVLLKSGVSFVIIADDLGALRPGLDENGVPKAIRYTPLGTAAVGQARGNV